MDVTEAPPGQVVDGSLELERAVALGVAQANIIRERDEQIAALGRELAEARTQLGFAVKQRDEVLAAAHRYETTSIRLSVENRALRERVEVLTRANHRRPARAVLGSWARRAGWSR